MGCIMGISNYQRFLVNIEREHGRKARKKVGNYLAQGYNPVKALKLAGVGY